jgi:hypothetical protein
MPNVKRLREALKRSAKLRLLVRRGRVKTYAYPRWSAILQQDRSVWNEALTRARGGPKILIATGVGGHPYAAALESLLAVALTLRGANVHFLLCDSVLPACELADTTWFPDEEQFVRLGPQRSLCNVCFSPAHNAYGVLGLPVHLYSECLRPADRPRIEETVQALSREEIANYTVDGIKLGEHARAGALRFYARGDVDAEPNAEGVLRRYLKASIVTMSMATRLLRECPFLCAVFQHGIYVPQGVLGEVARAHGVRVVNWNLAYRKQRFLFSHGDTYHRTMMVEPTSNWEDLVLHPFQERELLDYLRSRWNGSRDWIGFHDRPIEDVNTIAQELGVDFTRPCIGMLTNVIWDAQIHYPANAFSSMVDWVIQTIRYFAKRPELQLIVRIHPAEIRGTLKSRQPMMDEIRSALPHLPQNVFVIPPEKPISTYAVMLECDSVIIFGTKTGVELTSLGIPVIVAGEAWIRGKGISLDAATSDEYFALLDRLPIGHRLPEAATRRARTYAYHFFFRRMMPIELMKPTEGWLPYRLDVKRLTQCMPGESRGLDTVCRGILDGAEFIYPAEHDARTIE